MNCPACRAVQLPGVRNCAACGAAMPSGSTTSGTSGSRLADEPTIVPEVTQPDVGPFDPWPIREDAYEEIEAAGQGGMGTVMVVRHKQSGILRCRKRPSHITGSAMTRFLREIEVLKDSGWGDVVPCIDYGRDERGPFLVMPYYRRGSLLDRVIGEGGGPLAGLELFDLARAMGRALVHLHQAGVLHRDIKPANILLTDDGQPRLADFGLAKTEDAGSTQAHGGIGTAGYMAPELLRGAEATEASDLFSLGRTLQFAITGMPPIYEMEKPLPHPWRAIVQRCTALRPEQRYGSAKEFLSAVEASLPRSSTVSSDEDCPDCGSPNPKGALQCGACKASLTEACGYCHAAVRRGLRVCSACGANLLVLKQVGELHGEAIQLIEMARFTQAKAKADAILDLEPKARRQSDDLLKRISRIKPEADALRRSARRQSLEEGPDVAAALWERLLKLCPQDAEALQAQRERPQQQQQFEFERMRAQLLRMLQEEPSDAAEARLPRLLQMARLPEQHAACEQIGAAIAKARTAERERLLADAGACVGSGNFREAQRLLAEARSAGIDATRIAQIERRIRATRRGVLRRDAGIALAVVLLVGVGAMWMVVRLDGDRLQQAAKHVADHDHDAAQRALAGLWWPMGEANAVRALLQEIVDAGGVQELPRNAQWRLAGELVHRPEAWLPASVGDELRASIEAGVSAALGGWSRELPVRIGSAPVRCRLDDGEQLLLGDAPLAIVDGVVSWPSDLQEGLAKLRVVAPAHDLPGVEFDAQVLTRGPRVSVEAPPVPVVLATAGELGEGALTVRLDYPDWVPADLDVQVRVAAPDDLIVEAVGRPAAIEGSWSYRCKSRTPGAFECSFTVDDPFGQWQVPAATVRFEVPPPVVVPRTFEMKQIPLERVTASEQAVVFQTNWPVVSCWVRRGSARGPVQQSVEVARDGERCRATCRLDEGDSEIAIYVAEEPGQEARLMHRQAVWVDSIAPRLVEALPAGMRTGAEIRLGCSEPVASVQCDGAAVECRCDGDGVVIRLPDRVGPLAFRLRLRDGAGLERQSDELRTVLTRSRRLWSPPRAAGATRAEAVGWALRSQQRSGKDETLLTIGLPDGLRLLRIDRTGAAHELAKVTPSQGAAFTAIADLADDDGYVVAAPDDDGWLTMVRFEGRAAAGAAHVSRTYCGRPGERCLGFELFGTSELPEFFGVFGTQASGEQRTLSVGGPPVDVRELRCKDGARGDRTIYWAGKVDAKYYGVMATSGREGGGLRLSEAPGRHVQTMGVGTPKNVPDGAVVTTVAFDRSTGRVLVGTDAGTAFVFDCASRLFTPLPVPAGAARGAVCAIESAGEFALIGYEREVWLLGPAANVRFDVDERPLRVARADGTAAVGILVLTTEGTVEMLEGGS